MNEEDSSPAFQDSIIKRLIFLRQFLGKLKPISKKMDFQISRLTALATKDISEVDLEAQEDSVLLRPTLEDIDPDMLEATMERIQDGQDLEDDEDLANTPSFQKQLAQKVARAVEGGYTSSEKTDDKSAQRKKMLSAIRNKKEQLKSENKKGGQFDKFRQQKLLQNRLVKEIEDEMHNRPVESGPRANINGVYDPIQEKRDRRDENSYKRTIISKNEKIGIKKRVERLRRQDRIDDFSEIEQVGELAALKSGRGTSGLKLFKEKAKTKSKNTWQENKDEEKYDSKRQAKLRRVGKIKGKKKKGGKR